MACRAREAFPPCSLDGRVHVHAWFRDQFKDKIWNALESNARWQLSPQGRLFFEFETNQIKVNNVFDTSKSVSHHGHGSSSSSPGDSALHMSRGGSEAVVGPHATLWMSSSSVVVVVLCVQFNIPLPPNVGNLGTSFSDVSYIDGTLWIEKLRDPGTGNIYFSIFEYVGPCPDQPAAAGGSSQQQ